MALDPEPRVAETHASPSWADARPAVSVLISTFRRPQYLTELVTALAAQTFDSKRFEAVIVDNASADTTWNELVRLADSAPFPLRVARVEVNGGPATGRNAAAQLARADHVAFTDDDCLPAPGWVAAMEEAFADGATIVQGRTEPEAVVDRGLWDHTIAIRQPTDLFETCNLGYLRADVIEAGGFRPLPGYRAGRGGVPFGGEDTVLGWRVLRATNATRAFAADAVVVHRIEPRGYAGWLKVQNGTGIFAALVANVPELRAHMFGRFFFTRRSATFDLALLGLLAALVLRSFVPLLAVVPYVWTVAPKRNALRSWLRRLPGTTWGDLAVLWSLVRGSIRHRRVVL